MIGLDNVSTTFNRTWDSLSNGWNHLLHRASNALTRFYGNENDDDKDAGNTRWGLLSADRYDDDDKVIISIEAPGLNESDFDISIIDNVLHVKGEKLFLREKTVGAYTIKERAYGRFERVFPLQVEVDPDHAEASYKQGVLRIEINKSEQHKRRKIKVS